MTVLYHKVLGGRFFGSQCIYQESKSQPSSQRVTRSLGRLYFHWICHSQRTTQHLSILCLC